MPQSQPLDVSVIIPAYDAAAFVLEAIDSVLSQTAPPLEVIVVDDASSDGTVERVRSRPSVRCVGLAVNTGQAAALNRGVAEARGEYLAFLDADDVWRASKLEHQRLALARDPTLEAVYGLVEERVLGLTEGAKERQGRVLPAHLPSALLIRRAAFERVGPFDERLRVGSVVDWYARALALGVRLTVLSEVVYERRIHGANLGLSSGDQRQSYLSVVRAQLERRRAAERD